jgi:hypothetical protein
MFQNDAHKLILKVNYKTIIFYTHGSTFLNFHYPISSQRFFLKIYLINKMV